MGEKDFKYRTFSLKCTDDSKNRFYLSDDKVDGMMTMGYPVEPYRELIKAEEFKTDTQGKTAIDRFYGKTTLTAEEMLEYIPWETHIEDDVCILNIRPDYIDEEVVYVASYDRKTDGYVCISFCGPTMTDALYDAYVYFYEKNMKWAEEHIGEVNREIAQAVYDDKQTEEKIWKIEQDMIKNPNIVVPSKSTDMDPNTVKQTITTGEFSGFSCSVSPDGNTSVTCKDVSGFSTPTCTGDLCCGTYAADDTEKSITEKKKQLLESKK